MHDPHIGILQQRQHHTDVISREIDPHHTSLLPHRHQTANRTSWIAKYHTPSPAAEKHLKLLCNLRLVSYLTARIPVFVFLDDIPPLWNTRL